MPKDRSSFSIAKRYAALKQLDAGATRKQVMDKYGLKKSTLAMWVQGKQKIYLVDAGHCPVSKKNIRSGVHEDLDNALFTWFVNARSQGIPVSGPLLHEKGIQYGQTLYDSNFTISPAWIDRWKKRRGISSKIVCGESMSVTPEMESTW